MTSTQRAVIVSTGALLMAFVVFGIYTWIRVIQVIPYSSGCMFTLMKISQQSAMVRPFFLGAFVIGAVTYELSRRQLPRGWRFTYLVTLGLGAALIVVPWLISVFHT